MRIIIIGQIVRMISICIFSRNNSFSFSGSKLIILQPVKVNFWNGFGESQPVLQLHSLAHPLTRYAAHLGAMYCRLHLAIET